MSNLNRSIMGNDIKAVTKTLLAKINKYFIKYKGTEQY